MIEILFYSIHSIHLIYLIKLICLKINSFQYDNDGDIEYEFPAYIIREKDETLWKPWGNNVDCCYGGIRLSTQPQFLELLTSIFIRIQVFKIN